MFDKIFSLIAILILLVPIILLSILIKIDSRGPIIYWSKRIGKNNRIFLMPKLRTMRLDTPQLATHLITSPNNFITALGRYLRKYSMDEVPQFWSVFVGEMSIVGPRPALFNQDDLIELRNKYGISKLKPGITGWAQINGRDLNSIEDKVELERYYLNKKSFIFDIYIIMLTVRKIFTFSQLSH